MLLNHQNMIFRQLNCIQICVKFETFSCMSSESNIAVQEKKKEEKKNFHKDFLCFLLFFYFETVRPFHFFSDSEKNYLIVCEISDNFPKIIYPNGTKSVIKSQKIILLPNNVKYKVNYF